MLTTVVLRCSLQLCVVLTTVVNHSSEETGSGWGVIQGAAHPSRVQYNVTLHSDTIARKYAIQCNALALEFIAIRYNCKRVCDTVDRACIRMR